MPIYNNPALGQPFASIAGMFAPPSGSDAAGWARAASEKAAEQRLSWLFQNPSDPTASERSSLLGIQSFGATPDGFATTNATVMRGQNIESGDRRYGYDRSFEASRLNNADDNATSRANSAATVAGGIEQQKLDGLAGMFGPLAEGAVRPAVPADVAAIYGAPGALPEARGRAAPLSSDEVIDAVMQDMGPEAVRGFVRDKFAPSESQVQGEERRRLAGFSRTKC